MNSLWCEDVNETHPLVWSEDVEDRNVGGASADDFKPRTQYRAVAGVKFVPLAVQQDRPVYGHPVSYRSRLFQLLALERVLKEVSLIEVLFVPAFRVEFK